jgi:hypothetical protein
VTAKQETGPNQNSREHNSGKQRPGTPSQKTGSSRVKTFLVVHRSSSPPGEHYTQAQKKERAEARSL